MTDGWKGLRDEITTLRQERDEALARNESIARDRDMWRSQKDALAVRLNRQDKSIEAYQEIEAEQLANTVEAVNDAKALRAENLRLREALEAEVCARDLQRINEMDLDARLRAARAALEEMLQLTAGVEYGSIGSIDNSVRTHWRNREGWEKTRAAARAALGSVSSEKEQGRG